MNDAERIEELEDKVANLESILKQVEGGFFVLKWIYRIAVALLGAGVVGWLVKHF